MDSVRGVDPAEAAADALCDVRCEVEVLGSSALPQIDDKRSCAAPAAESQCFSEALPIPPLLVLEGRSCGGTLVEAVVTVGWSWLLSSAEPLPLLRADTVGILAQTVVGSPFAAVASNEDGPRGDAKRAVIGWWSGGAVTVGTVVIECGGPGRECSGWHPLLAATKESA